MKTTTRTLLLFLLVGCAAEPADEEDIDNPPNGYDSSIIADSDTATPKDATAPKDAYRPPPVYYDSGPAADCTKIKATIRDFKDTHPDFEVYSGSKANLGVVAPVLGDDSKPVFASVGNPKTVTSKETFDQWYRDVEGVNMRIEVDLPLTSVSDAGTLEFSDTTFFPINDLGFGNQGRSQNYHFTTEVHTTFTYFGGEEFTFTGDDDLFVFVDKKLALDLGGLHSPVSGSIKFDDLGLTKGKTYSFDLFHAERHTSLSNFNIKTNIQCFEEVIVI